MPDDKRSGKSKPVKASKPQVKKALPKKKKLPQHYELTVSKKSDYAMSGFNSNPSGSEKELNVKVSDFVDSDPGHLSTYWFDIDSNGLELFPTVASAKMGPRCRVKRVTVYALPRFVNSDVSAASVLVCFAVPVTVGCSDPNESSTTSQSAASKSTLLTPTAVSDWVKVGYWNAEKLFSTTDMSPAFHNAGNGTLSLQPLGTIGVYNPDNGSLIENTKPIQLRYDIEYSITIPPLTSVYGTVTNYTVDSSNNFSYPKNPTYTEKVAMPCMVNVTSVTNSM